MRRWGARARKRPLPRAPGQVGLPGLPGLDSGDGISAWSATARVTPSSRWAAGVFAGTRARDFAAADRRGLGGYETSGKEAVLNIYGRSAMSNLVDP